MLDHVSLQDMSLACLGSKPPDGNQTDLGRVVDLSWILGWAKSVGPISFGQTPEQEESCFASMSSLWFLMVLINSIYHL